jgi:hypothetical protein
MQSHVRYVEDFQTEAKELLTDLMLVGARLAALIRKCDTNPDISHSSVRQFDASDDELDEVGDFQAAADKDDYFENRS